MPKKITSKLPLKSLCFCLMIIFAAPQLRAQDNGKFSKNKSAYRVTEVKYNTKKNEYSAVKFFEAVVFTRAVSANKSSARHDEKAHVYTTEKNAKGKDRKPKKFMHDLKTRYTDGPVSFNKEFTMIYFSRNHLKNAAKAADGSYKYQLFESRINRNGLDSVIKFPFNSNDYNIMHPSISDDGSMLFFASDMPGGKGGMDIYFSKKSGGSWSAPINLGDKVNTTSNESFPFIDGKGILYFSSDMPGGMGGLDIYESVIKDDKGKKAYNMGEPVNSKNDDFAYHVSSGSGYISSNRKSDGKNDDIFELDIMREIKRGKEAHIVLKDKSSGAPLANTKLVVNADTVSTDDKGAYDLMVEEENSYKISVAKQNYFNLSDNVSAASSPDDEFTKELLLEKDPRVALTAAVMDAQTGQAVDGVSIRIQDMSNNTTVDQGSTDSKGVYSKALPGKHLGEKLSYAITLEKPGYLQKTVAFNYDINQPGEINLNDKINLSIGKVAVGMDIAKLIEIKPIYFDLGKPTIRPDAAIELDKIVAIMTEYPNMSIELGSHTDCRSAAALNLKLSAARAKASAAYISKKGIAPSRITGKGYGETKLLNSCACEGKVPSTCSEEEHTKNRRTEFVITKLQ